MKTALILFAAVVVAVAASESSSSRYVFYQKNYRLSFLKNTTRKGRVEYDDILYGRNLTLAQEQEKIAAWAKKYNRTEQVKKFRAERDASFKQLEQRIGKLLAALPSTFQEYLKIVTSADKTMAEIQKEEKNLYSKDETLFSVLKEVLESFHEWPRARPNYRTKLNRPRYRSYKLKLRERAKAAHNGKIEANGPK